MTRMALSMVCFALCVMVGSGAVRSYNPYRDTALADIRVRVMDDEGVPVEEAMVCADFYVADAKVETVKRLTDSNGILEVRHRCNWELNISVQKDGYYETDFKTKAFIAVSKEKATKTRKWSNGTVDIPVVLKRMRSPARLAFHDVNFAPIPATNEVVCLDLETFKWCPPYGNGKHRDLHLLYESWQNPTNWLSYYRKLTITTPNCVDGFTVGKADSFSRFGYAYRADTNATYRPLFVMELDRRSGHITKNVKPKDDEYLICRVRTQTNELGRVTAANYGRIGEKPSHMFGLRMRSWFNPTPNDTNLEDARP